MKRVMILAIALAIAPAAMAQLYKSVDKNGRVIYTDQPPANTDAKVLNIPRSVTDAPAPSKSYVAQDKENEKKKKDASEKAAKAGDPAKKAQEDQARCAQAKSAYQMYADGGRIYKNNEKGERVFLSDAEIEAERARSRREMDEACKGQ
ncbi:MAG: DUF4124 domain-containing protein [Usitatibacter sp.]